MTAKAKARPKAERTGDWRIFSDDDPSFQVLLGNCTQTHAESVKNTVANDSNCPNNVSLEPIESAANPPARR